MISSLRWSGAAILLISAALPASAFDESYATARQPFSSGYVDTGTLRVGYHMSALYRANTKDIPGGCNFGTWTYSYDGQLPPGIEFHASVIGRPGGGNDGVPFTGTPRQPGTWRGEVDVEFACFNNLSRRYRYRVPVTFRVEP